MDLTPPFYAQGEHLAIDLPAGRALFTTRRGGVSAGPYATLNLGRWTDDDPRAVARNRELVQEQLAVRFAYGRQVHRAQVLTARAAPEESMAPPEADGQLTTSLGLAPMVLTADCLPIAVGHSGAVAMLHAGWRGLAEGIIGAGIAALRATEPSGPLRAAIGPGAGPCCYEVGEEVQAVFADHGPGVRRGNNLDLKAIARRELIEAGVKDIHDCGLCTICSDPALFFSHRRDGGVTGRQAGIAWLS